MGRKEKGRKELVYCYHEMNTVNSGKAKIASI